MIATAYWNRSGAGRTLQLQSCIQVLSTVTALLIACAMLCGQAAAGDKSVYECQVFAHNAMSQAAENIAYSCGLPENWVGTWHSNYGYCRSEDGDDVDKVFRRRAHRMNMCRNICPAYAAAAAGDVKQATENRCPLPNVPGRFEPSQKIHFDWCVSGVSEELIGKEWQARYDFTSKCVLCTKYAEKAAHQAERNTRSRCGGVGEGWRSNAGNHYAQCMGRKEYVQEWARSWLQDRDNFLSQCPTQEEQAFCHRYADRAMGQRAALAEKKEIGKCNPKSLGSDPNRDTNYAICLREGRSQSAEAEARRDAVVKECVASWRPAPPSVPLPPGEQCNVSVLMTLESCTNLADGTPSQVWNPADLDPMCGLGDDEDSAKQNAIAGYNRLGIAVSENPVAGQCGYSSEKITGCGCSGGLSPRSYPGKRDPIIEAREAPSSDRLEQMGAEPPARVLRPPTEAYEAPPEIAARCSNGMILDIAGRCVCPVATVWKGRSCQALTASDKCPPGTFGAFPHCRPLAIVVPGAPAIPAPPPARQNASSCPEGFHGTPPNCCPRGTDYRDGACRSNASSPAPPRDSGSSQCPDGFHGTPPNCCPRGTEYRGGACRALRTENPRCPAGRPVGEPPNCCPRGTTFTGGACVRSAPRGGVPGRVVACPEGTYGTYPACCPRGTVYSGGVCMRKAPSPQLPGRQPVPDPRQREPAPQQEPQPSPQPRQQSPSPGDVIGPTRAKCPPGTVLNNTGRCVPRGPVVN